MHSRCLVSRFTQNSRRVYLEAKICTIELEVIIEHFSVGKNANSGDQHLNKSSQ